jgi:branched-chain amino acid transport system substrate-binding protein
VLGDAQSTEGGNAEVEKMNGAGVAAVVAAMPVRSACPPARPARYDLPYVVDVGVVDSIVTRGLRARSASAPASA